MSPKDQPGNGLGNGLRWIGRVWSLASLAFLLTFIVGHGGRTPSGQEWLGLIFFPGGVLLGLAVAWWKEAIGGGLAVASLAAFYLWHLSVSGDFPGGPYFGLVAAPGAFFLLSASVLRLCRPPTG